MSRPRGRPWTAPEVGTLRDMKARGESNRAVARALAVDVDRVTAKVNALGLGPATSDRRRRRCAGCAAFFVASRKMERLCGACAAGGARAPP